MNPLRFFTQPLGDLWGAAKRPVESGEAVHYALALPAPVATSSVH